MLCPFCKSDVKTKVLTSNIESSNDAFYHIYLCNSCREPFLAVEKVLCKEEVEKIKERNFKDAFLSRM